MPPLGAVLPQVVWFLQSQNLSAKRTTGREHDNELNILDKGDKACLEFSDGSARR